MTANVQLSGKTNDGRIFVVGAGNTDEFLIELAAVLGSKEAAEQALADAAATLSPVSAGGSAQRDTYQTRQQSDAAEVAQAQANVQRAFPDAAPVQQQAENPAAPTCVHGARVFKTGEKNGRTWKAYMCSAGQNAPDKCAPSWVK